MLRSILSSGDTPCPPPYAKGTVSKLREANIARRMDMLAQETTAHLDDAALHDLRARLRGELIRPDDAGYDDARTLYNGMIDKHPAIIARCVDVADVIGAVDFAR